MRDNFPADIVIRCALETGASLHWLATGTGATFDHLSSDTIRIPAYKFDGNTLVNESSFIFDKAMLPEYAGEAVFITDGSAKYLIDKAPYQAGDGKFLIEYSGTQSIKELTLLPGNKLRIDWGKYPIDCELSDVQIIGKVIMTMVANS